MARKGKPVSERLFISIPEAGELLGISRTLAYHAAKSGEIPTICIGTNGSFASFGIL
jgi:predicted DNA-binding transcriptional regulator AlpA